MARTKKNKATVAPSGKPNVAGVPTQAQLDDVIDVRLDISLDNLNSFRTRMPRFEYERILAKLENRERVDLDEVELGDDGDFINLISGEIDDIEDATGKLSLIGNNRPDGEARQKKAK